VRPEQLAPRLPLQFAPPPLVRKTLPNGLRLILLEDRTLPLVHIQALVKAGSIYDKPGEVGLARLAAASLSAAGTRSHPSGGIHETLESLAADLTSSCDTEQTTVTMNLLSKDLDRGLPLFAAVLLEPAFEAGKVDVERNKMIDALKRQNEDPYSAADRELRKHIYGASSEWSRTPTLLGLQKISRDELAAFHARYFKPGATIVSISGDIGADAMIQRLVALFGAWPGGSVEYPQASPAPGATPAGVLLFDRMDLTQATILTGELVGRRLEKGILNPDRYPMDILNHIIGGGGFNSTLMREIRSKRGLAYGAESAYTFGTDRGLFVALCQTGVESVSQVVGLIREILLKAGTSPPADKELALAKDSLINKFVFKFDRSSKIVDQEALLEMRGFPPDYLATYCDRIRKVTAADVQAAAKKFLHPGSETIVVVGPAKTLKEPLGRFGRVEVLPLPTP
jgi:predicted Zn-dependent peptidase